MRRFDVLRTLLLPVVIGGLLLSGSWRDAPDISATGLGEWTDQLAGETAPRLSDPLDPMRFGALQGNLDASAELATRLIDRFQRSGHREDLYEAFQWITRP